MGWETRGNNTYYYKKKRQGTKVVSEYAGTGDLARINASLEQEKGEMQEAEKQFLKEKRTEIEGLEQKTSQADNLMRRLLEGILLLSGYHKHKGQWRRRRYAKG